MVLQGFAIQFEQPIAYKLKIMGFFFFPVVLLRMRQGPHRGGEEADAGAEAAQGRHNHEGLGSQLRRLQEGSLGTYVCQSHFAIFNLFMNSTLKRR